MQAVTQERIVRRILTIVHRTSVRMELRVKTVLIVTDVSVGVATPVGSVKLHQLLEQTITLAECARTTTVRTADSVSSLQDLPNTSANAHQVKDDDY